MKVYPAVYQDKKGLVKTQLHNNFSKLSLTIRNVKFEGISHSSLKPATGTDPELLKNFLLTDGFLSDFSLFYQMTIDVYNILIEETTTCDFEVKVRVGKDAHKKQIDNINLYLALYYEDQLFRTKNSNDCFELAFYDLESMLPEGSHIKSCSGCAYAAYEPNKVGLFGNLYCFKKDKNAILEIYDKHDVIDLIEQGIQEQVQETYLCEEYDVREVVDFD